MYILFINRFAMGKKLSIILPVYNVEPYIERCIESIENQDISLDDYEIIIVNDGTPDDSMRIVNRCSINMAIL